MKIVRLEGINTVIRSASMGAALVFGMSTALQAQELDLTSSEGQAGYAIGVNIGMNLSSQGVAEDLNTDSLAAGLIDAINGELQMTEEQVIAAIQAYSMLQESKAQAALLAEQQASISFLSSNGEREEVTTTASGLQYEVMSESFDANAAKPVASDTVNVHYHGTLIDGTVFDSSVERGEPISFPLNGVIPGWTEGLQLMKVGDKFRFFIPSELAYGSSGGGSIGPNTTLLFEVELLGIE